MKKGGLVKVLCPGRNLSGRLGTPGGGVENNSGLLVLQGQEGGTLSISFPSITG